jgi:hypothetical protein
LLCLINITPISLLLFEFFTEFSMRHCSIKKAS